LPLQAVPNWDWQLVLWPFVQLGTNVCGSQGVLQFPPDPPLELPPLELPLLELPVTQTMVWGCEPCMQYPVHRSGVKQQPEALAQA
jgi:hypothetical protein